MSNNLLEVILKDHKAEILASIKEMVKSDPSLLIELGAPSRYCYCAEMRNSNDGKIYYHPMVCPKDMMTSMPTKEQLNSPEFYSMLSQPIRGCPPELAAMNERIVQMARNMYPFKIEKYAVSEEVFHNMEVALNDVLCTIKKAMDSIAELLPANQNLMDTFSTILQKATIAGNCIDSEANIISVDDVKTHNYEELNAHDSECCHEEVSLEERVQDLSYDDLYILLTRLGKSEDELEGEDEDDLVAMLNDYDNDKILVLMDELFPLPDEEDEYDDDDYFDDEDDEYFDDEDDEDFDDEDESSSDEEE